MGAVDRSSLPRPVSSAARSASGRVPREPLAQDAEGLAALSDAFWRIVDDGVAQIGLEMSPAVRAALDAQARLLGAWNAEINLTALRTDELVARGHVLDSLLAVPTLRALAGAGPTILDIGSGAGYPGLAIAVALPARRAALVDSIGKKAAFLEVVARSAMAALRAAQHGTPEIVALRERAEDLADEPDHREAWDLVTARAVGSLAEVAELGLPLTRTGGHVVAWKRDAGDGALEREIGTALNLIGELGGAAPHLVALAGTEEAGLPGHCLVTIAKRRPTPLRFPRPAGERKRAALP